ncbi:cobalamin biosynthesis protein [Pararhodospirillum photometricum]|uniref:Cobalamin (Vitamin B12) biosynthesis CbiG protein n=1 Tax=Pararhodospirillum photometricum DSM 122 TaxID=1150469 RepID=H6SJJ3_PARPM|nr:cobalamin biosynthesis protein [Pararhodospirillum photometricum]CCG08158.1 Cobalamin (Vitamin B12) biosynthesis CbiG protein [Pararhodospirillum photometricum DSM 122]
MLGVGVATACPAEHLAILAQTTLAEAGLDPTALSALATLAAKGAHPAIRALALAWDRPLLGFAPEILDAQPIQTPSARVQAQIGCRAVAEGAALAGAGPGARLLVPRRSAGLATCALALLEVS